MIDVEQEFPGPYWYLATVINREDPEGRYRVKVRVPGQINESDWAVPFGVVTGKRRGGGPTVPLKGSPVIVFWLGGHKDGTVVYVPGAFFQGWVPTGHVINEDGGDNYVWQNDRIRVEVDTRNSSAGLRITNLDESSGADKAGTDVAIDIDLATKQVGISTALGLKLSSVGAVEIEGGSITLNGRLVAPKSGPI